MSMRSGRSCVRGIRSRIESVQTKHAMKRSELLIFKTDVAQERYIMLKFIKKIIKIKLFVIGLLALLWFVKKKHHCGHKEEE